jgi:hypothetical protein
MQAGGAARPPPARHSKKNKGFYSVYVLLSF